MVAVRFRSNKMKIILKLLFLLLIFQTRYTKKEYIELVDIREIKAKSILRKSKKIDSWFISHYGMNHYRRCNHNCVYCDGRSEGYYAEGEFGRDISVKVNAIDVLRKELNPKGKRTPFKRSFIMIGGDVGDSYQNNKGS